MLQNVNTNCHRGVGDLHATTWAGAPAARAEGPGAAPAREPHPGPAGRAARHLAELPQPHRDQPAPAPGRACSSSSRSSSASICTPSRRTRTRASSATSSRRSPTRSSTRYQLTSADLRDLARRTIRTWPARCSRSTARTRRSAERARSSRRASRAKRVRAPDRSHLPSEEVSDLIQRHMNYFPELEDGGRGALEEGAPRPRGALPGPHPLPRQAARRPRAHRPRARPSAASCGASTPRRRSSR